LDAVWYTSGTLLHFTLQLLHGPHTAVGYWWLLVVVVKLISASISGTQSLCRVDTGSQVTNVAWSEDSPELVSFLRIKVVLSFVLEMVFLTTVKILFYIQSR
jgi:hypothetical protein